MRKFSFVVALAVVSLGAVAAHAQWPKPVSPAPIATTATPGTLVGLPTAQGALAFNVHANAIPEFYGLGLLVTCMNYPELNGKKNSVITVTYDGNDPSTGEAGSSLLLGPPQSVGTQMGATFVALGANLNKTYARLRGAAAPANLTGINEQWCIVTAFGGPNPALLGRYNLARFNVFAVPRP